MAIDSDWISGFFIVAAFTLPISLALSAIMPQRQRLALHWLLAVGIASIAPLSVLMLASLFTSETHSPFDWINGWRVEDGVGFAMILMINFCALRWRLRNRKVAMQRHNLE
ncbi:MAG: hypothetical protein H2056_00575 [Sphingopyxis sp.]|nr:hypothetical protein [Sphingopyxis sp.]